jgi:pantoate--beta-alanine ligase
MLIFSDKESLSAFLKPLIELHKLIGFVPTMGALHDGHLSLLEKSCKENDITIISIFVNPTQFNNKEDLEKYPRSLDADVEKVAKINKNILIYAPSVEDIYEGKTHSQTFHFGGLENQMEGKHRPGHFDGVGTIVKKLFEIINPNKAYFGEKDFQQLQIVKKLVKKEKLPIAIIGCPIYREKNGLAMSSRNERLSFESREKAALIYKTLKKIKSLFKEKSIRELKIMVKEIFKNQPEFELEYFEITEESSLLPCVKKNKSKKYRAFIAVFIDNIRLIDNISMN